MWSLVLGGSNNSSTTVHTVREKSIQKNLLAFITLYQLNIRTGLFRPGDPRMKEQLTFSQVVAGYLLASQVRRLSQHMIDDYLKTFRKFQAFL